MAEVRALILDTERKFIDTTTHTRPNKLQHSVWMSSLEVSGRRFQRDEGYLYEALTPICDKHSRRLGGSDGPIRG